MVTTTVEPTQISNLGEITVATRVDPNQTSEPVISLLARYTSAVDNTVVEELYAADDNPALNSPWTGSEFDRIVVNVKSRRQLYTVRSFNGIVPLITTGVVSSGSTFIFASIDPTGTGDNLRDIEPGEVLILLANRPYSTVDKILDQYIDVTSVTATQNQFAFFYNNGEFYTDPSVIQTVFPLIMNVEQ